MPPAPRPRPPARSATSPELTRPLARTPPRPPPTRCMLPRPRCGRRKETLPPTPHPPARSRPLQERIGAEHVLVVSQLAAFPSPLVQVQHPAGLDGEIRGAGGRSTTGTATAGSRPPPATATPSTAPPTPPGPPPGPGRPGPPRTTATAAPAGRPTA